MSKTLNRLVLALGIVAAPLFVVGCSEGEKPATPPAEAPKAEGTATPAPGPAETPAPAPATTPPAEPPK